MPGTRISGNDPLTAMTARFWWLPQAFGRRFFGGFQFEPGVTESIKEIESKGAVVYVMRYGSRLDYFLFNWLFLAEGVRLSAGANGIRFYYYRPLREALRLAVGRLVDRFRLGRQGIRERRILQARQVLREGGSLFLFLRTAKIRQSRGSRTGRLASGRSELDYLREIVGACFEEPISISLVPLALFWSRGGARTERRYLNVFYGAPARPSDTGKILSFLWNYKNLAVRVGTPMNLRAFVDERRAEGRERVVKQVRRSLLIFLRREEKPVFGATLRLADKVEEVVIGDSEVQRVIDEESRKPRRRARVEARARRHLREIAARQNGTVLAVLDVLVGWMFRRLFARFEVHGLDRIVEAAKMHPMVVVPSHRSHFDYLILSWLFYQRHLVPPHIAAGVNLAFWPLGPIFRRAGAFFLRRTFEGDRLYAAVFRSYVRMLIKDGACQEFFIEGTRSRTGKTLAPRLGMLGMIVEAFCQGVRRDLYLVPVGFTYELLVEESAIAGERGGGQKQKENLLGLLRARGVFRRRFGHVVVRFGEPISLADALGPEILKASPADPETAARRRRETQRLGNELSRRINGLVTAGRSSVSSAALLPSTCEGLRDEEFCARVEETIALLRLLQVPFSESLEKTLRAGRLDAVLELLVQGNLVERRAGRTGMLLHFGKEVRDRLDYYRASLTPSLVWGSVLALSLRGRSSREAVLRKASSWLDVLRFEYFPPEGETARRETLQLVLDHMVARGWVEGEGSGELAVSARGVPWMRFLVAQIRPVLEAYDACLYLVETLGGSAQRRQLVDGGKTVLKELLSLGEATFPESVSPITFGNALDLLLSEGVLLCEDNPNKAQTRFRPGPQWPRLQELRVRLAEGLESR
jgi:glycerol-3-phosphate O-acyltransferase